MDQGGHAGPKVIKIKMRAPFVFILAGLFLVLALVTTGCGARPPVIPTPELHSPEAVSTTIAPPSATSSPTASPEIPGEPPVLAEVILLAPPDADPDLASSLESALTELASAEGMRLERRSALRPEELSSGTRLVVGLAPDPGLAALAASAPEVQFLGVDLPGLSSAANISTVAAQASPSEQLGFLAGYLAAMVTPEWRVGVLAPNDSPAGASYRQGFINGVIFFCGLCRQTYPPFVTYPLYGELPSSASPAEWQAAAQALVDQSVQTIFLAPGADSEEMATYLGSAGVNMIATRPPPPGQADHWVATLQANPVKAVQELWPSLLKSKQDGSLAMPLLVENVNDDILTSGRMRLLNQMIADLEAGFIDPGTNPSQGG